MTPARKRRWFRFSLRTLFVVFALATLPIAVSAYYAHWIDERHYFLEQMIYSYGTSPLKRPPFVLWLLGEEGIGAISFDSDAELSDIQYAEKLFPEAEIMDDRLPSWRNSPTRAGLDDWLGRINEGAAKSAPPRLDLAVPRLHTK